MRKLSKEAKRVMKEEKALCRIATPLAGLRTEMFLIGRGEIERDEVVGGTGYVGGNPTSNQLKYRYEIYTIPVYNNFMLVKEVLENLDLSGEVVLYSVIRNQKGFDGIYVPLIRALDDGMNNFVYLG